MTRTHTAQTFVQSMHLVLVSLLLLTIVPLAFVRAISFYGLTLPSTQHFSHYLGVTNNVITSQVAGALVSGLFPSVASSGTPIQALIESDNYDALEPAYSCPNAVSMLSNYESTNASWTGHLTAAAGLYKKLDAVSGIASNDTGGWHTSFDQ